MTTDTNTQPVADLADTKLANAVIGIFDTRAQAERAVKELEKAGFDMRKLSMLDNKCVVVAHGLPNEVENARGVLQQKATTETEHAATGAARVAQHVSIS